MRTLVFLILVMSCGLIDSEVMSSLCTSWAGIEQNLKRTDDRILCNKNTNCMEMNCSGTAYGYDAHSGIKLNLCESPPSIDFYIDIPKLNVNAVKKKINSDDVITLSNSLQIEFELRRAEEHVYFGLYVHYGNNKSHSLLHFPKIPVFQNITFPVSCVSSSEKFGPVMIKSISATTLPSVKSLLHASGDDIKSSSNCTIIGSTCLENEICQQIDKLKPDGICFCISDYKRDESGKCTYSPEIDASTEVPGSSPEHNDGKSANVSQLLTDILVPITLIIIIVALIYAAIRFRVCHRLRSRLRVQVYEQVLLGQDDENEDESSNPVA